MQTTLVMELRVDFADADKIELMRQKWAECGRYAYATASLLQDNGVKPQMMMQHDDWFCEPKTIELMEDVLGNAIAAGGVEAEPDQNVSSELLGAMQEMAMEPLDDDDGQEGGIN